MVAVELPDGLRFVRTAGPFTAESLPPGLRRTHHVAANTWARLRVLDGDVHFTLESDPPVDVDLHAGDEHAIPPLVPHRVSLSDGAAIAVDFFAA